MGQLLFLISSVFALLTLIAFACRHRPRVRPLAAQLDWSRVARALFEQPELSSGPADRIALVLGETLERLELSYAVIFRHEGGKLHVQHLISRGYVPPLSFRVGSVLNTQEIYGGSLHRDRPLITIDCASVSPWRGHPNFTRYGWETYLASLLPTAEGAVYSLNCFSLRPRDRLFAAAEKRFFQQVSGWAGALLGRAGEAPVAMPLPEAGSLPEPPVSLRTTPHAAKASG